MVEFFFCVVVICKSLPVCSFVEFVVIPRFSSDADKVNVDCDCGRGVIGVINSEGYCAAVDDVLEYW